MALVIEIRQYVDRQGRNPFQRWFENLDGSTRARIAVSLDRLQRGNFSGVKGSGAGVFELRLDLGPGYRVYFGKDGETIVILLGGGTKKRQQSDIEAARALWQQYKQEKREG
ncbi:MAG: type II toxin-antitoxin system RelE/ParE family toxin [Terracidiphilus sp.]